MHRYVCVCVFVFSLLLFSKLFIEPISLQRIIISYEISSHDTECHHHSLFLFECSRNDNEKTTYTYNAHPHSSSYIIRCLHIPKEPLQPQHDLDWHRDVMNTIKTKQNKTMQSREQSREQSRKQSKAMTAILIFIFILSLTQIKSNQIKSKYIKSYQRHLTRQ